MTVTVYHNPRCSKSRETLALIEERGISPNVVLYLETPPSADEIKSILAKLGKRPREIMRTKEAPYATLRLDDAARTDAELIAAMAAHPILIERPIVVKGQRAALGRPPESVLEIL